MQEQLDKLEKEVQQLREELQALTDTFHQYVDHMATKGSKHIAS